MAKEKILIVDDEVDVLDLCKRILETQGYRVKSTHNGYEAIEIANSEEFDLLLTDIKMPGMSGLEIAQMLKESDPGIICVTMTGFSTMDMAINALKLGIDEFILKPFTPKELSIAVAKALEKERLRKENFRLRSLLPLFELNKTLMGTVDVDKLLHELVGIALKETKAHFAGLFIIENNEINAYYRCTTEQGCTDEQKETSLQLAKNMLEKDESSAPDNQLNGQQQDIASQIDVASVITSPLKSSGTNLGMLILANNSTPFAPGDNEFLSVLCSQASIALENARLFTEIQSAYEQLQILDHMKSEFINIAAHELRTPLAILTGYASVLEEEIENTYQEFVANIMRNAMRLRSLIDDMLNLKYLESGITTLTNDSLNMAEAMQEITQDISLFAEEKQLELNVIIPSDFPHMIVDRQKFDLIIMNLMHNAVKFTPPGGKITFSSQVNGTEAVLSVHNTGTTIPIEKLDRIFERFYQIESSLTRAHGGAGLGLAIARGMAEACGGSISVKSSTDDGTTFFLKLPLDNTHLEARKLEF